MEYLRCGVFAAPWCRAQEETGEEAPEPVVEKMLKDEIVRLTNIKASSKIRWASENHTAARATPEGETHQPLPPPDGWSSCQAPAASSRWRCCCRTTRWRPTASRRPTPTRRPASRWAATAPTCAPWPSARTTWPSCRPPGTRSRSGTGLIERRLHATVSGSGGALIVWGLVFQVHPAGDPHHGLRLRPVFHVRAGR